MRADRRRSSARCGETSTKGSAPTRRGRWTLQQSFNDRFVVPIEAKGEPSRWVTLRALEVLSTP